MFPLITVLCCVGLVFGTAQNYILSNGNLRLNGGRTPMEGRLEVFYMGYWGTICDDYWQYQEGIVACRQMGFPGSESNNASTNHLKTDVPILLDDVNCVGYEDRITDCYHRDWTLNDCTHLEDVYLTCRGHYDKVRLVGSYERSEGRVEVFHDGRWGTVCDSYGWWDHTAADVVCRQLGYEYAIGVAPQSSYEVYSEDIMINFLFCSGNEYTLAECQYTNGTADCNHAMDAAVICGTSPETGSSQSSWSILLLVTIVISIICTTSLIVVMFKINIKASRRRRRRRRRRALSHISGSSGIENPNYIYATPDLSIYHPVGYPAMPPSYDESQTVITPLSNETPSADVPPTSNNQLPRNAIYEEVSPVRYMERSPPTSSRDLTSSEEDDKEEENDGEGIANNSTNIEPTSVPPPYTPLPE